MNTAMLSKWKTITPTGIVCVFALWNVGCASHRHSRCPDGLPILSARPEDGGPMQPMVNRMRAETVVSSGTMTHREMEERILNLEVGISRLDTDMKNIKAKPPTQATPPSSAL
jgi:hypothetical protein